MLERTTLKPKLNFGLKLRKGLGSLVIDGTVKKNRLLVYSAFNFFVILASKGEGVGYERCGFEVWV